MDALKIKGECGEILMCRKGG